MQEVPNLINIGPTNPIKILNQHDCFWRFCMCPSNDTFNKNLKNLYVGTWAPQQRQEVYYGYKKQT